MTGCQVRVRRWLLHVCVLVGVAHFLHQVDGEQLTPIGVIGV